jgi:glucose/arabinose dehydrogenase
MITLVLFVVLVANLIMAIHRSGRPRLPQIESVQRIQVGPDDVLIITVPDRINQQQAAQVKDHVQKVLRTDRILVLADGTRFHVAPLPADDA